MALQSWLADAVVNKSDIAFWVVYTNEEDFLIVLA